MGEMGGAVNKKSKKSDSAEYQKCIDRISAVEEGYSSELIKAIDRIGETSDKVMSWMLRFFRTDFKGLSLGDWTNLRYEIDCFVKVGPSLHIPMRNRVNLGHRAVSRGDWSTLNAQMAIDENPNIATIEQAFEFQRLPTIKVAQVLQEEARKYIEAFVETGKIEIPIPQGEYHVLYIKQIDEACEYLFSDSPKSIFLFYLGRLIAENAQHIRRCPSCQVIYRADRRTQVYCSTRCQGTMNMRRRRGTPPERMGKPGRPRKKDIPKKEGGS